MKFFIRKQSQISQKTKLLLKICHVYVFSLYITFFISIFFSCIFFSTLLYIQYNNNNNVTEIEISQYVILFFPSSSWCELTFKFFIFIFHIHFLPTQSEQSEARLPSSPYLALSNTQSKKRKKTHYSANNIIQYSKCSLCMFFFICHHQNEIFIQIRNFFLFFL